MNAEQLIASLGLKPHPEGGHFVETFRDEASTAIYYLLRAGERSHWHRVDAAEGWHFYAGAELELKVERETIVLSPRRPQFIVPRGAWQSARSLGEFTLVGCTVAPPFRFEMFELAPPGYSP